MTTAINLNALLKQTIVLTRENDEWTSEQIIAVLMSNHVEIQSLASISVAAPEKTVKAGKAETEKKSRTRSAPAKPRAIPEDDTRCSARSFYEKEHIEDGVAKVMRDDPENLYGDRCKFKKTGDIEFCKHHSEKQPLGVWGAEYSGKFKVIVEKTENGEAAPAPAPKKAVAKPVLVDDDNEESEAEAESDAEAEAESDAEEEAEIVMAPPSPKIVVAAPVTVAAPVKKAAPVAAPAPAKAKPAPKEEEEEEAAEVEECVIDGKTYLKDEEGVVYDPETEDPVGKYNFKLKKWILKK
jgi:hypothetical protein